MFHFSGQPTSESPPASGDMTGLARGGAAGEASIPDLYSGVLSKEQLFVNSYKTNHSLFTQ